MKFAKRDNCNSVSLNKVSNSKQSESDTIFDVKVGYFNYNVKERNNYKDDSGNHLMGQTCSDQCSIFLDTTYPDQVVKETLLHELLHAILNDHGMKWLSYDNEETLIRYLSPRMMNMLHENPVLCSYIIPQCELKETKEIESQTELKKYEILTQPRRSSRKR